MKKKNSSNKSLCLEILNEIGSYQLPVEEKLEFLCAIYALDITYGGQVDRNLSPTARIIIYLSQQYNRKNVGWKVGYLNFKMESIGLRES